MVNVGADGSLGAGDDDVGEEFDPWASSSLFLIAFFGFTLWIVCIYSPNHIGGYFGLGRVVAACSSLPSANDQIIPTSFGRHTDLARSSVERIHRTPSRNWVRTVIRALGAAETDESTPPVLVSRTFDLA